MKRGTLVAITTTVTTALTTLPLLAGDNNIMAMWTLLAGVLVIAGYLIGCRCVRIGRSITRSGRKVRAVWRHADTLVES